MDENIYRQVLSTSISRPCPFEKSILTACASCPLADKRNFAEREVVGCSDTTSFVRCVDLRDALLQNFIFALRKPHINDPLSHAQEMRVQCGGLKGLQFELDGNTEVMDVAGLVAQALQIYGVWDEFPYKQIVKWATGNYRSRK